MRPQMSPADVKMTIYRTGGSLRQDSMHHAIKPRVCAFLSGVLTDFPALLEIGIGVVAFLHAVFEFLIAGAGGEDEEGGEACKGGDETWEVHRGYDWGGRV